MQNKRKEFILGAKWGIPVVLGFIPVGIAYAIMARQAGLTVGETVLMSLSVFAGASQMMSVGMYAQGASVMAIIIATFMLNFRHLIMSTCIINRLRGEGQAKKLIACFGVTDESFAVFTTAKKEQCTLYSFFGLILVTYLSWVTGSAIGAFASVLLPEIITASFGIALYAMFLGLLIPSLTGNFRLALLIVLTAVTNSLLSIWISSSWSLIISTLLCSGIGVFFVPLPDEGKESKNED